MHISSEYQEQQRLLHEAGRYGTHGESYAPLVGPFIDKLEVEHVLDYGCGSRLSLAKGLRGNVNRSFKYQAYDPCVEAFAGPPIPAQMVCCIDVLEHIEEDHIEGVLDHLRELTQEIGFFSISTGPAKKTLPDGRNAHVLQRPAEWWLPRLMCRFDLRTFQVTGDDQFYVVVNRYAEEPDGTPLT